MMYKAVFYVRKNNADLSSGSTVSEMTSKCVNNRNQKCYFFNDYMITAFKVL